MKKVFLFTIIITLIIFVSSPLISNATDLPPSANSLANDLNAPVTTVGGIAGLLIKLIKWIYTFIFIFAVLYILLSAYNFVTSGGNQDKVKKATDQLKWAIVGIAIALLSYAIVAVIRNLITSDTNQVPPAGGGGYVEVYNMQTNPNINIVV